MSVLHLLDDASAPVDVPTRDQICAVQTSGMQGLMVGALPWWDAALAWLNADTRQRVYAAKRAAGDTHCLIQLPSGPPLYNEGGQEYSPARFGPLDWTNNNTKMAPEFEALIIEVINAGFYPVVFLWGDDGQAGHAIAIVQLPLVVKALQQSQSPLGDLTRYVVIVPGWDGVF